MAISTETIRKITVQASGQQSVDAMTGSLQNLDAAQTKLAQSTGNSATVTDVVTKRQLSAAEAYRRQTLAIDDQARAQDTIARKVAVATSAFNQGVLGDVNSASAKAALAQRVADLNKKYGDTVDVFGQVKSGLLSVVGMEGLVERMFIRMAVLMAAKEIIGFGKAAFDNAAALSDQAEQAGVGVEAFQAYRAALGQNGVEATVATGMMERLTRSIGDAKAGAGPARDAFNQLGVGASALSGGFETAMPAVASALLKMQDGAQRSRLEFDLFGKSGHELESALTALTDPTSTLIEKQKALGQVLDQDVANGAKKASVELGQSWNAMIVSITPTTVWLVDRLTDIVGLFHAVSLGAGTPGAAAGVMGMPANIPNGPNPDAPPPPGLNNFGSSNTVYKPPTATSYPTTELNQYIAKQQLSASIAGLGAEQQAKINALVDAANIKLASGAGLSADQLDHFKNQDGTMRKFVTSTGEATDVLGKGTAAEVEGLAATIARGKAMDKVKETFQQYLDSLKEEAALAGQSAADRQAADAIIKGGEVYQKEHLATGKEINKTLQGNVDILRNAGLLQGVMNTLGTERDNQLSLENTKADENLAILQQQVAMVGQGNREQAVALAVLKEQQALKEKYGNTYDPSHPTLQQAAAVKGAADMANGQVDLTNKTNAYNESLTLQRDLLSEIALNAKNAAQGLGDALGSFGKGIGDAAAAYANYNAQQADFAAQQAAITKLAKAGQDVTAQQTILTQKQSDAEDQYYADAIDGMKNMFGQKTAAYKILQAVEGTYNALRLAGNIEAMLSDAAGVAAKVASVPVQVGANTTIAASGVTAGAGQIFAELGPWGFPVVAAMMAVMLGLGFAGSSGGSSGPTIDDALNGGSTAKNLQASQGSGTVLGDATAKSDSIANSLTQLTKDANADLDYSNQMVTSLKAIQDSIGKVAASLSAQLTTGGSLSTDNLGLGTSGSSGFLGLFSSSTTKVLQDQGVQLAAQTVAQIAAQGIAGQTYQEVQTTSKNSGFFGIGGGTSQSSATTTAALPGDVQAQITGVIGGLSNTVLQAADKLGITGAQAVIDSFTVNIGKISLAGMTGSQITDALNAVFSEEGDKLATAVAPIVTQLAQVGEGGLETLSRLVNEYTVVDDAAKTVGFTFSQVGLSSLAARDNLVQLSGGLDQFTSQAQFFSQNFLTSSQQLAPIQAAVTAEMNALGAAGVTTKDQFAALVQSIDTSTSSGAALYAALQNVAPAFAKVADASTELASKQSDLEIKLLQDQGNTLGATNLQRQQELAALDASLQPLQKAIYAQEDLNAANDNLNSALQDVNGATQSFTDSLKQTVTTFQGFADSLNQFNASIGTGSTAGGGILSQYATAGAIFRQTATAAEGGDQTALGNLQTASQNFLTASQAASSTLGQYNADEQAVKTAVSLSAGIAQSIANGATSQLQQQVTIAQAAVAAALANVPGHATGLSYVPYDNYLMRAHKGETVLTASQASAYRSGSNDNGVVAAIGQLHAEMKLTRRQAGSIARAQRRQWKNFTQDGQTLQVTVAS